MCVIGLGNSKQIEQQLLMKWFTSSHSIVAKQMVSIIYSTWVKKQLLVSVLDTLGDHIMHVLINHNYE